MKEQKQIIESSLGDEDISLLEGTVDEIIERLQTMKKNYPDFLELSLTIDSGYENASIRRKGKRLETDKEFNQRLRRREIARTAAKTRKEKELQQDRELYEMLKKKFESL